MPADLWVMRASVVVLLPPDPDRALACLEGLAAQPEEPAHEVVLVDDAQPALAPLLERVEGDVAVVRLPQPSGAAAAALAGVERAQAETVVLLDGRSVPRPGFLAPLLRALDVPGAGGAVARREDRVRTSPVDAPCVAVRRSSLLADPAVFDGAGEDAVVAAAALAAARHGTVAVADDAVVAPAASATRLRRAAGAALELSIVVPTIDAASPRVGRTLAAIDAATPEAHEVILVHNGAPPQGFSAPVNAGLRAARAPYLVVMNDDVEPLPGWFAPLRATLDAGAAVAFPHTVEGFNRDDFAAWCFAMPRTTVERHAAAPGEFFDPELVVHFQDIDLLLRLARAGTPPVKVPSSHIRHGLSQTLESGDPELGRWVAEQIARDRVAFDRKHPGVLAAAGTVATR